MNNDLKQEFVSETHVRCPVCYMMMRTDDFGFKIRSAQTYESSAVFLCHFCEQPFKFKIKQESKEIECYGEDPREMTIGKAPETKNQYIAIISITIYTSPPVNRND